MFHHYYLYSLLGYNSFGQRLSPKDQECFPSLQLKRAGGWKSIYPLHQMLHVHTHLCSLPVAEIHLGEFLTTPSSSSGYQVRVGKVSLDPPKARDIWFKKTSEIFVFCVFSFKYKRLRSVYWRYKREFWNKRRKESKRKKSHDQGKCRGCADEQKEVELD